jgi:tRNA1(Val) A37 N6-methylase TrmN6
VSAETAGLVASEGGEDGLLGGRVRLLQPRDGYRAAIDPVMLAAAVPAKAGERVLDLGCGVGAAALCLAARVPGLHLVGLELQPELAALAVRNAGVNAAELSVLQGDVASPPKDLGSGYDRVLLNPPFHPEAAAASPLAVKDLANREGAAGLRTWLELAVRRLRQGGTLSLIHRADRLAEVLAALPPSAGDLRVLPLWPRAGRPARRILLRATCGSGAGLSLLPGLVLHAEGGGYTPEAEAVLRDAAALAMRAG